MKSILSIAFCFAFAFQALAAPQGGKYFDRAIFVIFENTNYKDAIRQPFFARLAQAGASFSNFMALTHPSQGNYIALTSGSLFNVSSDNDVNLNVTNLTDLLEAKGLTWKVYAENYPGHCFQGSYSGDYARKHNPFISYVNIQRNQGRCANIVDATEFDRDAHANSLPNYVFYIPNQKNDGHDTGVSYADRWYSQKFSKYLGDAQFMENTVLISTFDESGLSLKNQIYTSIVGPNVKPGAVSKTYNIYSLLALIEDNWSLGTLGREDSRAPSITDIWRQ